MDIRFIQSSDPTRYLSMLAATAANVSEYCRRHGFGYEAFVGVKRGYWPWQAAYNRIIQYHELLERGFGGWAIHVDADAWINDLDFDLRDYLSDKGGRAAILAEAGVTGEAWDINDGIVLLNLGHPEGRRMVEAWHAGFLAIPDDVLREARTWLGEGNDQDLLQRILRDDHAIASAVLVESQAVINSRQARFIRQHYRSHTADLGRRIAAIAAEVAVVAGAGPSHTVPVVEDDRASAVLRHPNSDTLSLAEAGRGEPDLPSAEAAIAYWHGGDRIDAPAAFAELVGALERRDRSTVAAIMADLGKSPAADGHLGGQRQHRRALADPAFAAKRALRTHDALTSLAEACGALSIENPENGLWGFNVRRGSADLLARVGATLAIDVTPPAALGCYLGIDAGEGRVLHLRMIEALHAAWRMTQVQTMLGLAGVREVGGAFGLRALYAARLGNQHYEIVEAGALGAVQAYLLAATGVAAPRRPGGNSASAELLFDEESLTEQPEAEAIALIRAAREGGTRAILSVNHEARPSRDGHRPTMRDLVASAGGFRLAQRTPHAIRPGFVEELFLRT